MANSTIKRYLNVVVKNVVFTHAGYQMWNPDCRNTHRILQSTQNNILIGGDGSDFCSLIQRNDVNIRVLPADQSPITISCLVIPK